MRFTGKGLCESTKGESRAARHVPVIDIAPACHYSPRTQTNLPWRILMRRTMIGLFGLALLFSSVPLFSQSNDAVEKALQTREQSLWQSWKDHDPKPVEAAIVDPSVNIAGGSMDKGKAQIVKGMMDAGCKVESFSLSNFSYIWLDKDS